jgi:molecular chaperone DnaJ
VEIPTLDGPEELVVPAGAQTGDTVRLEGRGVPRLRRNGRGDQLVTLVVVTPEKLTVDQQTLFEQLGDLLPGATVAERERSFWSRVKERFG